MVSYLFLLWFPIPLVFFQNLWGPFQELHLLLVSLSLSCFWAFSTLWQEPIIFYLFASFYFHFSVCRNNKIDRRTSCVIMIIITLLFASFSQQLMLAVFHGSLSDNKSPGLCSVFWPISTMLWCAWFRFFLWFPVPPVSLPSAQNTIGITVKLVFHSFFIFLARSKYLSLFLLRQNPLNRKFIFSFFLFFSFFNLVVYFYCLYQDLQFFSFFCKYLYIIYMHKVINFFFLFCEFVPTPIHFLST